MADRYFVDEPIQDATAQNDTARLVGAEAHHLAHVMRAKVGDVVVLFDGSGAEFSARIEKVGRAEIQLAVVSREAVDRELPLAITLAVALPKGDRQRWLVEKATELGAAELCPLETEHSGPQSVGASLERLRRGVIEAAKQCGRNRLMEIGSPMKFSDLVATASTAGPRWLAHPGGADLSKVLAETFARPHPAGVTLAIGPEGGFAESEVERARAAGWQVVGLGRRILRVETAALALAAAVASRVDIG
jgi:16S rRNA (uracil1498-N3)-methyltransferase